MFTQHCSNDLEVTILLATLTYQGDIYKVSTIILCNMCVSLLLFSPQPLDYTHSVK